MNAINTQMDIFMLFVLVTGAVAGYVLHLLQWVDEVSEDEL